MDLETFLTTNDIFAPLSEEVRANITRQMQVIDLQADETIFEMSQPGDAIFFILHGQVELSVNGIAVAYREVGECFGEFSLIDQATRSATAVCRTTTRLARWPASAFHAALIKNPKIAIGIVRLLTAKLREDVTTQVASALERERWRVELQWAREVQQGLLPPSQVNLPGFEFAGYCSPAHDVGGDFYDYVSQPNGLSVLIGDVTGHGLNSALLAAMAKSCFRTQVRIDTAPISIMLALARVLNLSAGRRMLMSACYLQIDNSGAVQYSNAGHPPALHLDAQTRTIRRLESLDPILGALDPEHMLMHCAESSLALGDVIVFYTDGISEARRIDGKMFGEERLKETLLKYSTENATTIRDAAIEAVNQFSQGKTIDDDITMVVLRRY